MDLGAWLAARCLGVACLLAASGDRWRCANAEGSAGATGKGRAVKVRGAGTEEDAATFSRGTAPPKSYKLTFLESADDDFMCISPGGIGIRAEARVDAARTGESLKYGDVVKVRGVVDADGGQEFLELTDGRGWVFTKSPKGTSIMCKPADAPAERHPHAPPPEGTEAASEERVRERISGSGVLLFMKGTPEHPKCRHSRGLAELLKQHRISFDHVDVLEESDFRVAMWARWPTYPQLWVEGLLLGGIDSMKKLAAAGELLDAIHSSTVRERVALELSVSIKSDPPEDAGPILPPAVEEPAPDLPTFEADAPQPATAQSPAVAPQEHQQHHHKSP